jgi:hypothetical protein
MNYIFGGFNFLMWIAFIVTIVCVNVNLRGSGTPSLRL